MIDPGGHVMPESPQERQDEVSELRAGRTASEGAVQLKSYAVGPVPILEHFFQRLQLAELLDQYLPEDPRGKIRPATGVLLLIQNILISREPIYGVAEWASLYAPEFLGLTEAQLSSLNDDRLGRLLDRLFKALTPELLLDVVRQAVRVFGLRLDELHNDSTTISFHGRYTDASEERLQRGRKRLAITYGHSKDHRPDLKQLLYVLTVTDDGGVPVYFTSASGNVADVRTHIETWDLLRQLVGRPDFLYVADCKLASSENLDHLTRHGGRFVTVMPALWREDGEFRRRLSAVGAAPHWRQLYEVREVRKNARGVEVSVVVDQLSVWAEEQSTSQGYRLLWYYRTRKAEHDRLARQRRTERALAELNALEDRLSGPRPRLRERSDVEQAVHEILEARQVQRWVKVQIQTAERESFRQVGRGRPNQDTTYVREVQTRFHLLLDVDAEQLEREALGDGVFPLLTNDRTLDAEAVARAYQRQPQIEKRFNQFKNDFEVAPVYLKEVSRIQGLLTVYFLALLVQTLLERELRQAMQREKIDQLPLYAEGRACRRPTARKLLDLFEPIQRHELTLPDGKRQILTTERSPLQTQILSLLKIPAEAYTHPPSH
jgi:transposase